MEENVQPFIVDNSQQLLDFMKNVPGEMSLIDFRMPLSEDLMEVGKMGTNYQRKLGVIDLACRLKVRG